MIIRLKEVTGYHPGVLLHPYGKYFILQQLSLDGEEWRDVPVVTKEMCPVPKASVEAAEGRWCILCQASWRIENGVHYCGCACIPPGTGVCAACKRSEPLTIAECIEKLTEARDEHMRLWRAEAPNMYGQVEMAYHQNWVDTFEQMISSLAQSQVAYPDYVAAVHKLRCAAEEVCHADNRGAGLRAAISGLASAHQELLRTQWPLRCQV